MLWYWLLVSPALLLTLLLLRGGAWRAAYVRTRLAAGSAYQPPATVIVPVKGAEEGLRDNLAALAALDYPDYELIVAAREARDIPPGVLPPRAKVVLAHGGEPSTGEKVQNLQAAVRAARSRTEVFAFADSDGRVPRGWLKALVAPLAQPGVGASTGFRWFMPAGGFWSLMRSVWDAVAGGALGPGDNPFAWGGAMAVRKQVFIEARVSEHWKGTVSDDYALSGAVHGAGFTIAYAPGALTPSHGCTTARELFGWMRRQMVITRIYSPRLWWKALIPHVVYCSAMALSVAVALGGYLPALAALAVQLASGMLKGYRRAALARACLPASHDWFRRYSWVHVAAVPLATWLWLIALLSSASSNAIVWRGYRYELKRPAVGLRSGQRV